MSTPSLRKRVEALEEKQRKASGVDRVLEPTDRARYIGLCLSCAANGWGKEEDRDHGRRWAIMFARNRVRTGDELSPSLSDLILRAMVGRTQQAQRPKRLPNLPRVFPNRRRLEFM